MRGPGSWPSSSSGSVLGMYHILTPSPALDFSIWVPALRMGVAGVGGCGRGPEGGRRGATWSEFQVTNHLSLVSPVPFCLPCPISLPFFHFSVFFCLSVCLSLAHPVPPPCSPGLPSPSPTSFPFPTPCPLHGEEQTLPLSSLTQVPPHPPPPSFPPPPPPYWGEGGPPSLSPPFSLSPRGGVPGREGGSPRSACGSWRCVWWGWQGLNGGEGVPAAAPQAARAWASAASGRSASQW